jgi:hypothetical protein
MNSKTFDNRRLRPSETTQKSGLSRSFAYAVFRIYTRPMSVRNCISVKEIYLADL